MKEMKVDGDLHIVEQKPSDFETIGERENWLGRDQQENILDSSMFYTDFPPLPDFPCMSSTSSSSSTPALTNPMASSSASSANSSSPSSSAASWAVFKSDAQPAGAASSSTASMEGFQPSDDCMDMMETFGFMDLVDGTDFWDPSSVFHSDTPQDQCQEEESGFMVQGNRSEVVQEEVEEKSAFDELGGMFFEWLKTNKEHISADDMRNIKLKRSTIESASKRLGSTKEGKKQLLKLILEWVEQCQLQKKKSREEARGSQIHCQYQEPFPNPNPNPNPNNSIPTDPNTYFPPPWIPPPQSFVADPATGMGAAQKPPVFQPVVGYMGGDPYSSGVSVPPVNFYPYPPPPPTDNYQMLESAQSWPPSHFVLAPQYNAFPENSNFAPFLPQPPPQQPLAVYGDQYPYPVFNVKGERLLKLGSSATREARKKRMAHQRRYSSGGHHYRHNPHQNKHHNDTSGQQHEGEENCNDNAQSNASNWAYWPPADTRAPVTPAMLMLAQPPITPRKRPYHVDRASAQPQSYQRQAQSEPKQGYNAEKNLKFLLQKVLKQSDVGSLGRIVLPKKEAEVNLPELESRDGMPIAMEDIGTSTVWNMRYRFWPNNKSRMYLLENTGEFVKANGLQEGDFIVIYSDLKGGKYLIRGVKVRQQGPKAEGKKPSRRNHHNYAAAADSNGNSSLPYKQTTR